MLWDIIDYTIFHISRIFFHWRFLIYFISTENWIKKGKYPNGTQIFTFFLENKFVWRQRFQKKFDKWNLIKTYVKKNLMLQFSCLKEFRKGNVSRWWALDELQYKKDLNDQLKLCTRVSKRLLSKTVRAFFLIMCFTFFFAK